MCQICFIIGQFEFFNFFKNYCWNCKFFLLRLLLTYITNPSRIFALVLSNLIDCEFFPWNFYTNQIPLLFCVERSYVRIISNWKWIILAVSQFSSHWPKIKGVNWKKLEHLLHNFVLIAKLFFTTILTLLIYKLTIRPI